MKLKTVQSTDALIAEFHKKTVERKRWLFVDAQVEY